MPIPYSYYDDDLAIIEAEQAAQRNSLMGMGPLGPQMTMAQQRLRQNQQAQVERWQKPAAITPYQQAQIDRWERQDAAKSAKPVVPPAVMLQYKSLLADEKTAMAEDDARKANRARIARQIFEQQHPELGLNAPVTSIQPPGESVSAPAETRTVRGFKIRPVQR